MALTLMNRSERYATKSTATTYPAIRTRLAAAILISAVSTTPLYADDTPRQPETNPYWRDRTLKTVDSGLRFFASTQQENGGWTLRGKTDPAVSALITKCFIQDRNFGPDHPIVLRSLKFILKHVQPDGGIYVPDMGLRNYYTSVSLMAIYATRDDRYAPAIQRARAFLQRGQWDEAESHDTDSSWYGGAGYGKHKRPDLSNTQMMLEALHQSGLPETDQTFQKALVFISRCQMLGEHNDQKFAKNGGDGGFIYTPVNGGESKAGTETISNMPRLRSYGSMTYAGFKSMLYAGLSRNDPRIKSALGWIRHHYTLDVNPNMPSAQSKQGLYYYYHVFARALSTYGDDTITDSHGRKHHWRRDLCNKLTSLQRNDGSWVNESDRWFEGDPHLVSAYAILAIQSAVR